MQEIGGGAYPTVHEVQDEAELVGGVEGVRHADDEGAVLQTNTRSLQRRSEPAETILQVRIWALTRIWTPNSFSTSEYKYLHRRTFINIVE